MATTERTADGVDGATSGWEQRAAMWDAGAEVVHTLSRLREDYDGFLRASEDLSRTTFTDAEAARYRRRIVSRLGDLVSDGDGPARGMFYDQIRLACRAAASFGTAPERDRARYRERGYTVGDRTAYDILLDAAPTPVNVDEETLMEEFRPGPMDGEETGTFYALSRSIIDNGGEILDSWVDGVEDAFLDQRPATTPADREDTADRIYQ